MSLRRWFRNEPLEPIRRPTRFDVDTDARRVERRPSQGDAVENEYSITVNLGGFTGVSIPWGGTSREDARDSFFEFLYNHEAFGLAQSEPQKFYRSLSVNFHGKRQLLVFRTNWITGFTVS